MPKLNEIKWILVAVETSGKCLLPDHSLDDEYVKNEHCSKRNQMNIQRVKNSIVAVKLEVCSFWSRLFYDPNTCEHKKWKLCGNSEVKAVLPDSEIKVGVTMRS